MNIAVIAHLHYPIKQPYAGGLEAHTDLLIRQLIVLGHTVTLYAKSGSLTGSKVVPVFTGNSKGGKSKMLKLAYRYACNHIALHSFDLIFNNSLDGYPFIWHTANMPPMITIFHTPPFWELSDVLMNQEVQDNRRFIAVSELTARQWQPYCKDVINVVPNGIDMKTWKPYLGQPSPKSAVWVGRITPEKGTHIAIEAAQIARIPLTICGKVYDDDYFKRSVKPYIDQGLVKYSGHLNQQDINKLYGGASVALVTPVWEEPFGLVTVEALASGTPVAGLDHGATGSILGTQFGCLAKSDDPQDLAIAINQAILLNRSECADYAHTSYSIEAMVTKYLDLLPQPRYENEAAPLQWQTYP
jgi:glycosyltransferase involved in cell wall biosynthesis